MVKSVCCCIIMIGALYFAKHFYTRLIHVSCQCSMTLAVASLSMERNFIISPGSLKDCSGRIIWIGCVLWIQTKPYS